MAIRADVADESQVQSMFKQAIEALGTIDVLVNNAGLQQAPPSRTDARAMNKVIAST